MRLSCCHDEADQAERGFRELAARGFRGYPIATVAFYGPDNTRASKVAVGVVMAENKEPVVMQRWFSDDTDVRHDPKIGAEIVEFLRPYKVKSVVATDRIIGCPHEEGEDYPVGESCPTCPFWEGRDRFTHELV